jgi:RNA polymerase sigma factor (sigma-70 family)
MTTKAAHVLRHVRQLAAAGATDRLPDRQLLQRFLNLREEDAFEAILRRHGPLVLGVCRRLLGNRQDAEDAFQATFLILAEKAASIHNHQSLSSWLYGVAYRVAVKARSRTAARRRHEQRCDSRVAPDPLAEVTGRELLAVVDEELHRLDDRHRAALVLCYLEGKTRDQAAAQLGWSLTTLQRRLEEGRECLRARLARRGLGLPAALLTAGLAQAAEAALPARLLAATLRTAVHTAPAAALRLKVVAAVLLALGTVALSVGAAPDPAGGRRQADAPAPAAAPLPQGAALPKAQQDGKELTVSGRVFDAGGKAGLKAEVVLVGVWQPQRRGAEPRKELLARAATDHDGNYRLTVPHASPGRFHSLHVLAGARGHGLGWRAVERDRSPLVLNLSLRPDQTVAAVLIDLQGQPARGVKVRVFSMAEETDPATVARLDGRRLAVEKVWRLYLERDGRGFEFGGYDGAAAVPFWPAPAVTTDAKGRLVLRGFGGRQTVHLLVEDERFAVQELVLKTGDGKPAREVTVPLDPARRLEGRVLCADSGQPVAGAVLHARTSFSREAMRVEALSDWLDYQIESAWRAAPLDRTTTRTDEQGRFRLPLALGDSVRLQILPPAGIPYLGVTQSVRLPRGTVKHSLEITLPRGVPLRGRVTEQDSGEAIDQAEIYFRPLRDNNPRRRTNLLVGEDYPVFSDPDGGYHLVLPPQPGHLLMRRPGLGLIERPVSRAELYSGKPDPDRRFDGILGGERLYFHTVHFLDVQPTDEPRELALTPRRGVTLRGRVVGPDGKAVNRAVLFCGGDLLAGQQNVLGFSQLYNDLGCAVMLEGGRFELRGCDPMKTYRLFFLDNPRSDGSTAAFANVPFREPDGRLGAVVDVSARQAAGPITVRLSPCGAVEFRRVDTRGKGEKQKLWLDLLVAPRQGHLGEEKVALAWPFPSQGQPSPFAADKDGRIRLRALIPGATYRLKVEDEEQTDADGHWVEWGRDFTVEAGQTRRLPDLVLPRPR